MPTYEENLRDKLSATRAPITAGQYIKRLRVLNDNMPLTSMKFLLDFDTICNKIDSMEKAFSTKTSYYIAVSATLTLYPKYSKIYKKYSEKVKFGTTSAREENSKNEKNEKQKESMIPLTEVMEVREKLKKEFDDVEKLAAREWNRYIAYILLCLYTMIPPRRNRDYSEMVWCMDEPEELEADKNYYVVNKSCFIFNTYKTSEVYGKQVIDVPEELNSILVRYIDLYRDVCKLEECNPLLIHIDGNRIHPVNGITKLLNKVFKKKIGSSALRHIYISDTYKGVIEKQKADAEMMAHSLSTQKDYYKS